MSGRAKIVVVLSPGVGLRLVPLARASAVWARSSPANCAAARAIWSRRDEGVEADLTIFDVADGETSQAAFLRILNEVDIHHPDWAEIEAVGVALTADIRVILAEYGVGAFVDSGVGFGGMRGMSGRLG